MLRTGRKQRAEDEQVRASPAGGLCVPSSRCRVDMRPEYRPALVGCQPESKLPASTREFAKSLRRTTSDPDIGAASGLLSRRRPLARASTSPAAALPFHSGGRCQAMRPKSGAAARLQRRARGRTAIRMSRMCSSQRTASSISFDDSPEFRDQFGRRAPPFLRRSSHRRGGG